MRAKLLTQAIIKLLAGALIMGGLLFGSAGTLAYWNGWLLLEILFAPMLIVGAVLLVKSPALLAKRLQSKERQKEQSAVVKASAVMFLCGFAAAGLQYRCGWLLLPRWVSLAAAAVFLAGYLLYAEVLRENAWLSRTVEVQAGQTLVDTGLYALVRHPMYSATLLLFLSMPLVLGSWVAFLIFLAYPVLILQRIRHEERLLVQELPGYCAYRQRVRYRLIPFVW